jgi:hypothetical protein
MGTHPGNKRIDLLWRDRSPPGASLVARPPVCFHDLLPCRRIQVRVESSKNRFAHVSANFTRSSAGVTGSAVD